MRAALNVDLPDAPESLRRGTPRLHDLAYAYLKGLLLGGGLDPGDQISSDGVGRVLSISRAPVSDAIRRLTVEGLLEILPQVGCRVVRPVPAEMKDLYEMFGATEGVIARMAAERRSAGEADDFARLCASLAVRRRSSRTTPMRASSSYGGAIVAAMKGCTSSPARPSAPISARPIGTAATSLSG